MTSAQLHPCTPLPQLKGHDNNFDYTFLTGRLTTTKLATRTRMTSTANGHGSDNNINTKEKGGAMMKMGPWV